MSKKINMMIQCPSCKGTGVYSGMGESEDTALVCHTCKGTGEYRYIYEYEEFTGLKTNNKIKRVYLSGYGYKIGLGKVDYKVKGNIITIDMDKQGVSYEDFQKGKKPTHIKELGCPMSADQGACHKIDGFTDECNKLNGGWLSFIPDCNCQNKMKCWDRFEK